ncbi:MAG: exopolysaccharide biosynthesis polyprenyl glycosylphosphotransferase [Candidatus Omnitrophica bacterium]|nr:exopolysaccharide biosynthesis polyprenyl glycosylphosphotransferase [Candidatus Omnitrophota bacterium]
MKKSASVIAVIFLFLFFIGLKTLSADNVDAKVIPHAPEPASMMLVGGGIVGMIVRFARKRFQEFKRGMDIVCSLLGLIVAAPLVALTAVIIKLTSRGPVFFKQERVGKNGTSFNIYKFRTMRADAEKYTGPVWAQENDPRVTLAGKILRRSHIDEIPQLINVLKGEMAIVGPRPERPCFVKELSGAITDYNKRLTVKPGITGLAQVWHRYDETIEDVKKKIKYDLLYIKEMCVLTDLRIMARTILVVLTGKGAR